MAPKGTILVDKVLFYYSKLGRTGDKVERIINFNEMVRNDGLVHNVLS